MSSVAKGLDPTLANAVKQFAQRLVGHFPVQGVILFGSRARGTHRAGSDADVAVLLNGTPRPGDPLDAALAMADVAWDVLLQTEIYIHPLPVWESQWKYPETHPNPRLLRNIYGIPLTISGSQPLFYI